MLTWVRGIGSPGLARLFGLLFDSEASTGAVSKGSWKDMEAEGTIKWSMNWLLSILNLPSKSDYNRLLAKVEILQGSLMNLNIKVDRLLAARDRPRREPPEGQGGTEDVPGNQAGSSA